MRVLLLNPPGRRVYLRDYFCSKESQADYINHPIDLVYQSGRLDGFAELAAVDAIVEKLSFDDCLNRVEAFQPDAVLGLIGSVSYPEDVAFYRALGERVHARLTLIGDILIDRREERLKRLSFAEAFLHDFSGDDFLRFLEGIPAEKLNNLTVREGASIRACPIVRPRTQSLKLPLPRHDLFVGKPYRYPFVRSRRFATVLTEFGCPYRCNFCVMSTLGWQIRPVENVLTELDSLRELGCRELFFLDQTFGIQKDRTRRLLETMAARRYGFGWVCFSRPDLLDDRLTAAMKRAGCHTVILGVESGDEAILRASLKDTRTEQVRRGFEACGRAGLRTVATVILGLPEETGQTFRKTMRFLRALSPDFVSFNVAVPRMGTPLRLRALSLGLIDEELEVMDQSGSAAAMPTLTLSRREVESLRRRAVSEFYFNLGYLSRRLSQAIAERPSDWLGQLKQGASLAKKHLQSGNTAKPFQR